jgi:hypothetical protein
MLRESTSIRTEISTNEPQAKLALVPAVPSSSEPAFAGEQSRSSIASG